MMEQASLYVLGMLGAEESRAFEQHLAECAACTWEVEQSRRTLSGLALASGEFRPPAGLRDRLFDRIRADQSAPSGTQIWKSWAPTAIGGIHVVRGDESSWSTISEGIEVKQLFADPVASNVTMLVRMAPGSEYPAHRHGGHEQCFVIEGDVQVGDIELVAGDYQCATADSVHDVTRTRGGCVLMIVSSTRDKLLP
jgi:anti-sigma factor ChrR (cupin superfamily)